MAARFTEEEQQIIKSKLIESAYHSIIAQGMQNTTIGELAEEANISTGAFYNFYSSKEALFFDATSRLFDDLKDKSNELLVKYEKLPTREQFIKIFTGVLHYMESSKIIKFYREDLEIIVRKLDLDDETKQKILRDDIIKIFIDSGIKFKVDNDMVATIIRIVGLSMVKKNLVGSLYEPAMEIILSSICDNILAE